jgi:hypothetical protein
MHAPNSNERYFKKIFQSRSSIKVLINQPNDHITICVDQQNYKPRTGSISYSVVQIGNTKKYKKCLLSSMNFGPSKQMVKSLIKVSKMN